MLIFIYYYGSAPPPQQTPMIGTNLGTIAGNRRTFVSCIQALNAISSLTALSMKATLACRIPRLSDL